MAAEQDVIREFLVALGFKIDQKGLKSFTEGVSQATKGVAKMVAAIEGAALTIGTGIAAMASRIESLGFVANRVGSSGNSLRALSGAAQDFGVSADTALGSVENLARFLRNNPAGEAYLHTLGVQTRQANGQLRDTVDILGDIGTALGKRPQWLSTQYAGALGIDENLQLAMRDPAFLARLQQIRKESANNGFDKAAAGAHEFMTSLRELGRVAENVGIQVQAALQGKIGAQLKGFTEWAQKNAPTIADRISDVARAVINASDAITPALKWIVDKFLELDRATGGISTQITLALGAFKILGGFEVVSGIWKIVGAMRGLAAATVAAAAGAEGASAAAGAAGGAGAGGLAGILTRVLPATTVAGGVAMALKPTELGDDQQVLRDIESGKIKTKKPEGAGWMAPGEDGKLHYESASEAELMALNLFQKLGWSKDQAAGIVANLKQESSMNPGAVGDQGQAYGIAQWHADRQAEFAKWSGHDIRSSDLAEQLRFVDHELRKGAEQKAGALLAAATNAQQAGEIVSRHYERPAATEAEAQRRGNMAAQLSAHTNIYVNGTADPAATARMVQDAQGSVNDDLVRTMQGAHG